MHQIFDSLLSLRIGRTMGRVDKAIIGILSRIECTHTIEFPEQNSGQKMIHCKRIILVTLQNLFKLLHRAVIIKIVEVIECGQIERIVRTIRQSFGVI